MSAPRFGRLPNFTEKLEINDKRADWHSQIAAAIAEFDNRQLQTDHPLVAKALKAFGLPRDWRGLPPALEKTEPGHPEKRVCATTGALAQISLEIMDQLQKPEDSLDAFAQLSELMAQVTQASCRKINPGRLDENVHPAYLGLGGYDVAGTDSMFSMLQTGHIVLIAENGAMQMIKVPSANEMIELIRHDEKARKLIDEKQLIKPEKAGWNADPTLPGLDAEGTIQLLEETAEGKHPDRAPYGWADLHTLLRDIPFDLERHLKEGRLKLLYDSPGQDEKNVWEARKLSLIA